jgi:DNA-binding FadR family transcriptional regulator
MPRLKEQYAPALLAEIAAGEIAPDTTLTEDQIGCRYAISRGSARELIQQLELCGALEVHHGRGAIVRPPSRWNPLVPMVIRTRLASPQGRLIADDYFEAARWFLVLVAMAALDRSPRARLSAVGDELRRLEEGPPVGTGAAVDAALLRAWAADFGGRRHVELGVHVGDALALALDLAVERIPALGGSRQASLDNQRMLYEAAARRDRVALVGVVMSLMASQPESR